MAEDRGPSRATELVMLVEETGAELFHSPEGGVFARIGVNRHHETWPLRSTEFRDWLGGMFYQLHETVPSGQALADASNVLSGKARYMGRRQPVHVRIAGSDEAIFVDLADEKWQTVRITADGWDVLTEAPVRFRRARGMEPLRPRCMVEALTNSGPSHRLLTMPVGFSSSPGLWPRTVLPVLIPCSSCKARRDLRKPLWAGRCVPSSIRTLLRFELNRRKSATS